MAVIHKDGYTVQSFPVLRRFAIDAGRLRRRQHMMHGLLEIDITTARQIIKAHKSATGQSISLTAFVITCLVRAVESNREVQAMVDWLNRLVIFDDVNVTTIVEVDTEQGKIAVPRVLRSANHLSLREIQDAMHSAKQAPSRTSEMGYMRWFLWLPGFLRLLFYSALMRTPQQFIKIASPVLVTSVGMFGRGGGWGLPMTNFTLTLTIGGIAERPGIVEGHIEAREYLDVTLSFDHDIIDGAPAARFTQHFRELLESAYGLAEITA